MSGFSKVRRRLPGWPAASVIVLALSACGGGGGGIASIPNPPQTSTPAPTPSPTPTASAFTIGAPARATAGANPAAPVLATEGGLDFTTGPAPGTAFPGLQTVLYWANFTNDDDIAPDAAAIAAGAKVTANDGKLEVDVPTWQTSIELVEWGHASLDWTRVSYWNIDDWWGSGSGNRSVFVFGYETPAALVPATGTATYSGMAEGRVFYPLNQGAGEASLTGNAEFTANFGTRMLSGTLTGMWAGGDPWFDDPNGGPWNSVNFNSTISGNAFSGTAFASTAPGGLYSLSLSATGTVEGKFFGPSAQEAGAVWTLFDGTRAAIGTLSGKR